MTLAGITDGTSNTVAFGEWRMGTGNPNVAAPPRHRPERRRPSWLGGELATLVDGGRRDGLSAMAASLRGGAPPTAISTRRSSASTGRTASIVIPWAPCSCRPTHSTRTVPFSTPSITHHVQSEQLSPRRCQRRLVRRFGSVPQEQHQSADHLGPGLAQPGRDHLLGLLLTAALRKKLAWSTITAGRLKLPS